MQNVEVKREEVKRVKVLKRGCYPNQWGRESEGVELVWRSLKDCLFDIGRWGIWQNKRTRNT